ncbi:hypothetical protein DSECCO2_596210 [anaerobic digester metagenome]
MNTGCHIALVLRGKIDHIADHFPVLISGIEALDFRYTQRLLTEIGSIKSNQAISDVIHGVDAIISSEIRIGDASVFHCLEQHHEVIHS